MSTDTDTADALEGWDLPDSWTPRVRDVLEDVLEESPDLTGAALATLFAACDLLASGEALDDVARAAGYMATGAAGHVVSHPATIESRLARTAAAAILKGLRPDAGARRETQARRAARARHGRTSTTGAV